ncbi:MAG: UPF0182 family protein [Anaerovoracaceae bacterium]
MEKNSKKKFGLKWILVVALLIVLLLSALVGFITDFLWFKELGYVSVFFKQLFTQLKIGVPTLLIVTFLSYIYLKLLKRNYENKTEIAGAYSSSINKITWGVSAAFGIFVTYFTVTRLWFDALKFFNATNFDIKDPLFNMDISFYVFKLDFIMKLNEMLITVLVAFIILTILYYFILMTTGIAIEKKSTFTREDEDGDEERYSGAKNTGTGSFSGAFGNMGGFEQVFEKFGQKMQGGMSQQRKQFDDGKMKELLTIAKNQLIIVGVIFFLMLGISFFLKQYSLLYTATGAVYGAGYTDVNVTLWLYRILMGLAVLGAITVAIGVNKKKVKIILAIPAVMIIVGLVGSGVGSLVQNFVVSPDEINKESKYLKRNIEFTQKAYGLADVAIKPFAASNNLTSADLQKNEATIKNIRVNDYQPVEKFYNQTQSIRQYYKFNDVDVDRYNVNGQYTQTFLSGREIDEGKISPTWLNKQIKYTHGYGITLSRVNAVTASGQPEMLIDSIPPVSRVKEINITRPEIYFGELSDNYIIVGTDEEEFDYPDGQENAYSKYEGAAGIKLSPLNRLMFAIKERSLKLLVSSNIDNNSKIIINRNIKKRINKIMPYLSYDEDPYMVTVDGKLYWIAEGFTSSSKYPYSEPYDKTSGANYIRNSVKVVVDVYNGDTDFYVIDESDPIAMTYKNIYPKLFKSKAEMPKDLVSHIRYPNSLLQIQADVYKRYHMTDVKVFYQKEDLWDISKETYGTEETQMTPNYYILNLPGEKKEEFVNSIPYTPRDKKNMTALLMARNDGDKYGDLVLFQLPKGKVVYGPMQIEAQIDQNTEISKEFSLWNSSGSTYTRGNMFVIPIEDSLLYVEPVYLEATNSSIPEVKRVIVAYNDKIAYEPTLSEALDSLFGPGSSNEKPQQDSGNKSSDKKLSQSQVIKLIQDAYDASQEALKKGDWTEYGKQMDMMEKYLGELK